MGCAARWMASSGSSTGWTDGLARRWSTMRRASRSRTRRAVRWRLGRRRSVDVCRRDRRCHRRRRRPLATAGSVAAADGGRAAAASRGPALGRSAGPPLVARCSTLRTMPARPGGPARSDGAAAPSNGAQTVDRGSRPPRKPARASRRSPTTVAAGLGRSGRRRRAACRRWRARRRRAAPACRRATSDRHLDLGAAVLEVVRATRRVGGGSLPALRTGTSPQPSSRGERAGEQEPARLDAGDQVDGRSPAHRPPAPRSPRRTRRRRPAAARCP